MPEFYFICLLLWGLAALVIYLKYKAPNRKGLPRFTPVTFHDDQLTAVIESSVGFKSKPILWPREYRAYKATERILAKYKRTDCRIWAQVCLGELFTIEAADALKAKEAHSSINSKRSDIVLTDSRGYALALIEYHGDKHYQHSAYKRDAIKRLVAQRAGIRFIEVIGEWSDQQIEDTIDNALQELLLTKP